MKSKKVTDKITVEGDTYYAWERFLLVSGLQNRKSIYDWVKTGKAEVYKVGTCPFYKIA